LPRPSIQSFPTFPTYSLDTLVGFVTHCSATSYAFCIAGALVVYKSKKLQPVVATSSTEAEFDAAVIAGRLAKYLCSILADLQFPQTKPTVLYEDQATIALINEQRPTS
jgi:hypothetical protein